MRARPVWSGNAPIDQDRGVASHGAGAADNQILKAVKRYDKSRRGSFDDATRRRERRGEFYPKEMIAGHAKKLSDLITGAMTIGVQHAIRICDQFEMRVIGQDCHIVARRRVGREPLNPVGCRLALGGKRDLPNLERETANEDVAAIGCRKGHP